MPPNHIPDDVGTEDAIDGAETHPANVEEAYNAGYYDGERSKLAEVKTLAALVKCGESFGNVAGGPAAQEAFDDICRAISRQAWRCGHGPGEGAKHVDGSNV